MKNYEQVFESTNIYYVKLTTDLIDEYLKMVNDPDIASKITHNPKTYTYEDELNWIKDKIENKANIFSMIEKETGDYIGNVEIMEVKNDVAEVGICITANKQNKHLGREALTALIKYGKEKLYIKGFDLNVYKTNVRAVRCYEKAGFIADGEGKTSEDLHMFYSKFMKLEIKKVSEEEAETIIDINKRTWKTTFDGIIEDAVLEKLQTKTKERIESAKRGIREKNNVYGIYVNNKLVGYASYGPARDEKYKGSCEIYTCYILKEYQSLHLGRKVVIKILEDFIKEGYKTMITKCLIQNPSNRFHKSIGGEVVEQTDTILMGEKFIDNVYYHKDIKQSLKLNQEKMNYSNH